MRTIIYGPPGTGKTHTLLGHIEKFLETTDPDKIGYFTFSKNAAEEGKQRAANKFKLSFDDLPYFQTLHSFCFNQLGLTRDQVMKEKHYKELGEKMGLEIEGTQQDEDHDSVFYSKNPYIQLINIARSKEIDPVKYYHLTDNQQVSLNKLKIISEELERYKSEHGLIDFPDMIEKFLAAGEPPKLRVMFVDEAQDLCKLQWRMINKITENARQVYISGDDDQAIYNWAGADVRYFIQLPGEVETLKQSFRCSRVIQNLSGRIINRVKLRRDKQWRGTERAGLVQYHTYPDSVNLRDPGSWLVMARTNYMLDEIERDIRLQGMLYKRNNKLPISSKLLNAVEAWKKLNGGEIVPLVDIKDIYSYMSSQIGIERGHKTLKMADKEQYELEELVMHHGLLMGGRPWDVAFDKVGNRDKEYLRAIEVRGTISKTPKINISTIHGAKGGEADNVMLLTDLSRKSQEAMERDSDDECRVFYVGATRARETLHVVQPQRDGGFII